MRRERFSLSTRRREHGLYIVRDLLVVFNQPQVEGRGGHQFMWRLLAGRAQLDRTVSGAQPRAVPDIVIVQQKGSGQWLVVGGQSRRWTLDSRPYSA